MVAMDRPEMPNATDERSEVQPYRPPALVHYGTIEEWTLSGGPIIQVSIVI